MVTAAKKISQVGTHMAIAFALMYALTGSAVWGGMAVLVEPVINVVLLPFHAKFWAGVRAKAGTSGAFAIAGEKLSQTGMHMLVAFGVMYWATGSTAFGGLAAILEPVLNVVLMPLHDRLWEKLENGQGTRGAIALA